jgi:hypothetical protein
MDLKRTPRCQGTTRAGQPCAKPPVTGAKYCREHHGNAILAAQRTNTRSGRYIKGDYVPTFLKASYEAFLSDPDLGKLTHNLAVANALFTEFLQNWRDAPGVSYDEIDKLTLLLDRIANIVDKHSRITHRDYKEATSNTLTVYMAKIADVCYQALEQHVTDVEQRQAAARQIRAGVSALGVPDV